MPRSRERSAWNPSRLGLSVLVTIDVTKSACYT